MGAIRVAVQQQQRLFREGLGELLGAEEDVELCGLAASGQDLVELCADHPEPHVALLEADTSDWDVPRLCATLRRAHPGLRLIGLTAGSSTPAETAKARRSGMCALVSRATGIAGILAELRVTVSKPGRGTVAAFRRPVPAEAPWRALLTDRELHVLHLVGAGCTSREISTRLGISHKTVENHKQRVFGKLGVQNQAHAVSVAMRAGFLRADQVLNHALAD